MDDVTNDDRAEWALTALRAFGRETRQTYFETSRPGSDDGEAVGEVAGDLICDLLHLARQAGVPARDLIKRALMHFREEVDEEDETEGDEDFGWETVGHVGVDSGMVVLADPFYVSGDRPALDVRAVLEGDDYSPVHSLAFDNGIDGGVIVGSGWGDGIYPVEARMSDGRVAEVRVRFMPHPVLGADPIALLTGRSSDDDETELPRCKHCGHDESYAGYGPVTEYKGVLLCKPCLVGVKAVEEEDGWVQDPTTLQWVKPGGQS